MTGTALLCTDGSDLAIDAISQSLALLAPVDRMIVVTVSDRADAALMTGTGFTGDMMTGGDYDRVVEGLAASAQQALDETIARLKLTDTETMLLQGRPGVAICDLAASLPASVVVIGTHGTAGFRRSLLGSTSDYVVRHAVCPVLVQGAG